MGCFQERKTSKGSNGCITQKNLENLERTFSEIWRKISHKAKSVDLRLQQIHKLVLKSGIIVAKVVSLLYETKKNQEASILEVNKEWYQIVCRHCHVNRTN